MTPISFEVLSTILPNKKLGNKFFYCKTSPISLPDKKFTQTSLEEGYRNTEIKTLMISNRFNCTNVLTQVFSPRASRKWYQIPGQLIVSNNLSAIKSLLRRLVNMFIIIKLLVVMKTRNYNYILTLTSIQLCK